MKNLAILDDQFKEVFQRDMRVYLVKSEEEFTRFALMKYREEIKLGKAGPKNTTSSNSNLRGISGKTQTCSDKSIQQNGQKLKCKEGNNVLRKNKTANEFESCNLNGAIVNQRSTT